MYPTDAKKRSHVGPSVCLDPFGEDDVDIQYQSWLRDDEIAQFLVNARFEDLSLEGLRHYVRSRQQNPMSFFFKIVDKPSGHKIGTASLSTDHHQGVGSYGYIVGEKQHWGGTQALEALVLLLDFAFDTLKLRRVTGSAFANNVSSRFNFRRLGFSQEGIAREHIIGLRGEFIDSVRYGILVREWKARSEALDRFRLGPAS